MWKNRYAQGYTQQNVCKFSTVQNLRSPLWISDQEFLILKATLSVNSKGNQPWIFTGRSEAPVLWQPGAKSSFTGKDWCWERLRAGGEGGETEDEIVGWHHRLNGHEFEQAPGVVMNRECCSSCPACCSPWVEKSQQDLETERQQLYWCHLRAFKICSVFSLSV